MTKSTTEIRQEFLNFFQDKGHKIVPGGSLLPINDPTLLFTSAGMNQFKNIFLGLERSLYQRVVTVQRCMRAGGKHNDLNNVGYTSCHHTFFEMLGNFSFGDYFKYDAIKFAWELLTSKHWFNLSIDKLWITVHVSDNESYKIWLDETNVLPQQIIRIGDKRKDRTYDSNNFWNMGDVGPCGPCSEIFYDHGAHILGGPPGSSEEKGDRYVEIWNLVFMQFNRQISGELLPLPIPSVDTGMGLERISAVLQSVDNNYKIDLFRNLIIAISQIIGVSDLNGVSLRVIADHIRACIFLIHIGVIPSNEGRGYVLRRIIRRAIRHGRLLCINNIFLHRLVEPVIAIMNDLEPEFFAQTNFIKEVLFYEEKQFSNTLRRGLDVLDIELSRLNGHVLDGKKAFYFYSTYGLPLEFTVDVCHERGLKVDTLGFENAMLMEQKSTRSANILHPNRDYVSVINQFTRFIGYDQSECVAEIVALFKDNQSVEKINVNEEALIVLDWTPFYGESGGQIGDCGELKSLLGCFLVINTQKYGQVIGHLGRVTYGSLKVGNKVTAKIDKLYRLDISLNHSAVHLLHSALCCILGNGIFQKGSFVNSQYLRFDFSHNKAINQDQIYLIEDLVNQQIRRNLSIVTEIMSLDAALNKGAKILINEKYNDQVRVLIIGEFSIELCCGTHASRTGDLGLFIIKKERSIASGIHRIEAITGKVALSFLNINRITLFKISQILKVDNKNIVKKIDGLLYRSLQLEKEIKLLKDENDSAKSIFLVDHVRYIKGIKTLLYHLDNVSLDELRNIVNRLKHRLKSVIIVLAVTDKHGEVHVIVGVTEDLFHCIDAIRIIDFLSSKMGGKGGGGPGFAQGGGYSNKQLLQTTLIAVDALLAMSL
ncbi:alanine--tRNA ligase [Blochmannia endosymbiont of Colobopsis nipponica]|uniref:alanine--tRNA ligase n=1 Tax=Blochmannia endosymbiont of Colobopsis nipponica TaxID=2681987 RepID=UPI00178075FD|nr:alanine--tRNA ligase [Blochmannia endosymbiont of Colobopsis nipponica]QOI11239.1 alanine--tRNA ligase [Blochmannia endosymbiont of Colobopsis nipponica]